MKILQLLLLTIFWVYFPVFIVWSLLWLHSSYPLVATVLGIALPALALAYYLWRVVIAPFRVGMTEGKKPTETLRPCPSDR
jgi:hypothetical protein